jgi:basic amino acid/polyamine antiporter, APA family
MENTKRLSRNISIVGLVATGISSMIGASIYIVPFMLQKNVPGIGPYILPAFLVAAIPALFAAICYAILSSAMPRAGGSYVYASRSIHPYWGFVASFSQWFGLSIVIGIVSYMVLPFFRDVCVTMQWSELADFFDKPNTRLFLSLGLLWSFILINIFGVQTYQFTIIGLVIITFLLASIVIIAGFIYTETDFIQAVFQKDGIQIKREAGTFNWQQFLGASSILFASFIGFDSIAQAGGEAKNPSKSLPKAILITILTVTLFYLLFTYSVYSIVPWNFVQDLANTKDISVTSLLNYVLPPFWSVLVMLGASIALLKDLPSMVLSVSRLCFAWSKDQLFPVWLTHIHPKYQSPYWAILFSGSVASMGILGCHFASDIFLGIDIMVISMLINFILICVSVLLIHHYNPILAKQIAVIKNPLLQKLIAVMGILSLGFLLFIHIKNDMATAQKAWYFHASYVCGIVMLMASLLFLFYWNRLKKTGLTKTDYFKILPAE